MLNSKILLLFFLILALLIFSQCCTSKEKIKEGNNMTQKTTLQKSLPRGTIDASCTIVKIVRESEVALCTIKIKKVYGTGGGVRPIAEGSKYEVLLDEKVLKQIRTNDEIGNIVRCRLVSLPSGMGQENKNRMKIVSVNKSKNNLEAL